MIEVAARRIRVTMVNLREQKKSQRAVIALRSLALKITSPGVGCPRELQR
jgi:hypothetical protein